MVGRVCSRLSAWQRPQACAAASGAPNTDYPLRNPCIGRTADAIRSDAGTHRQAQSTVLPRQLRPLGHEKGHEDEVVA